MADLRLNANLDLDLTDDRLSIVEGADAVAQKVGIRLRFFRGEWLLDTRIGLPYYQEVFVKNPDLTIVNSLFRRAILTTPGITELTSYDLDIDPRTRVARLSFQARADNGETVRFSEEFIL